MKIKKNNSSRRVYEMSFGLCTNRMCCQVYGHYIEPRGDELKEKSSVLSPFRRLRVPTETENPRGTFL